MAFISTHNLVKDYVNGPMVTNVLKGIDFAVEEGEFVSIMGPSGSGKSTLLYQLGLIDKPTNGIVEIEEHNVSDLSDREKQLVRLNELGFVFQDYALIPELTAAENVMVSLLMKGYSKANAKSVAVSYLDRFGLGTRVNNLPSQLSGGEQQRVSIARAVAHKPKILFADEPTASLDSTMSEQVIDVFLELHKDGQTIIMVTHEPEYGALTERIVQLRDGSIVDHGVPKKPHQR
jgi:putative ABC transport system ATP-binding protein